VLAAQQLGAERIIAMSRHESRQQLAREYGATDIVIERRRRRRPDQGPPDGLGAHSVIEAVGTQESMMQAIRSTRPGGHVGYVGVAHDVQLPRDVLFFSHVHLHGGPAPVRRLEQAAAGYQAPAARIGAESWQERTRAAGSPAKWRS
jgi:threonine dehydrogenase-like Zn-dependent dehydrogenase